MPDKHILKATEPSLLRVAWDPEEFRKLLPDQQQQFAYHILRLFRGEGTAESEWEFMSLKVDLRPYTPASPQRR